MHVKRSSLVTLKYSLLIISLLNQTFPKPQNVKEELTPSVLTLQNFAQMCWQKPKRKFFVFYGIHSTLIQLHISIEHLQYASFNIVKLKK